ncbi:hypothetical protein ACOMHN_034974 [Nucella lapillus]
MLFVLSQQVCIFLFCVMTVDRILALFVPFTSFHFVPKSALAVSAMVWVSGFILAAIPLSPAASQWQFNDRTAVCVPLPIADSSHTDQSFQLGPSRDHQSYYFVVFRVLNIAVCLVQAVGQGVISWTLNRTLIIATDGSRRTQKLLVARRVVVVVIPNITIWFLTSVLGMLAVTDIHVPDEVHVLMTVLVLSLGSALNPVFYAVAFVLQGRRKRQEQLLLTILARQKGTQQQNA